jgi:SNF2 family DNA or RNA helicase
LAVLISPRHDAIVIPYRKDVHNLLPTALPFDHNGKDFLKITYGIEEVKLLNNLGIKTPAPILNKYNWPGMLPFDSQKKTAALLTTSKRAYVLSSMGVGKTRAALFSYDFLYQQGIVSNCLVVAPLSTLVPVWEGETFETFHHLSVGVLHGTKAKRLNVLGEDHHIYVINHDGVKTIQSELIRKKFDTVIIDELAVYRNRRTDRWKALRPIITNANYAWGLTGAPTPNGPTDAYGQVKLLTPERMRMSFRAFQQQTMRQITQFKWLPRPEANDVVHEAMQPSVRFALDECHDLPPITVSSRDITLSTRQKKAYKQLISEYAMESKKDGIITVVNEAARINKLIQVGAGFAYTKDGKGEYLDAKPRLKIALDLVKEAEGKVIVFASYKWAVAMLERVLHHVGTPLEITGATPKGERDKRLALFRGSESHRILVAHPGCMAHGINLQCASTIIWYTPTHSLETYIQANARITRPGQKNHMNIIHLAATPVERRVFKKLAKNEKIMGVLLSLFKDQKLGV